MYYLIGKTLGHSYSAEIHRAFGKYPYELKALPPEALGEFLSGGDFDGMNVTIPYKSDVIPYLDEIDDAARKIGSVNTVVQRDGRLVGHNTDYAGFLSMAERAGISFAGKKVLILGTGGTSLTAQAVVRDAGASEVVVLSRRGESSYATLPRHLDSQIIINSTPVGMYPQNGEELIELRRFSRVEGVLDVIYNPLRTRLIDTAERLGIPSSGGLWMLVAQAALAAGYFAGERPTESEVEAVYRSILTEKENIVLVGMPGCGKTTVAGLLAERSGREVIDTDRLVTEAAGMPIPEIFARYGEAEFRRLESEAAEAAGKRSGVIIATGGGIVLDPKNRYPLVQNGKVYFLRRETEQLDRSGRPLSGGADLAEMYRRRLPLYLAISDRAVDNNRTPDMAADEIWEDFHEHPDCKRTQP
jgi:shikimate dehydrogenase